MVHFIAGLILSCLLIGNAWSKCDDSQIIMQRSTSFGISWGDGSGSSTFGSSLTVNIPLRIDGKQACYHQSSAIQILTEKVKDSEYVEYEITPLEAEFENVPSPTVRQYINIDYESENQASHVQMMSFLCSGETPIGADAFGDSLLKLSTNTKEQSANIDMFIATGLAADNLQISQAKKAKVKVYDRFLELYETKIEGDISFEEENSNIFIPSVLIGTSISAPDRKLYSSFFSRTNSSINGCSKKFTEKMQEHLIENVIKNNTFKNIDLRKKRFSSKLKMRWSL